MNLHYQELIEQYITAYNKFDVAGMMHNLHKDIYFENISNGETTVSLQGTEEFRQQAEQVKSFFRSREQKITNLQIDGDTATVAIEYTGVLNINLPNGMNAGDTMSLKGKSTFVFQDNKIIHIKDES